MRKALRAAHAGNTRITAGQEPAADAGPVSGVRAVVVFLRFHRDLLDGICTGVDTAQDARSWLRVASNVR